MANKIRIILDTNWYISAAINKNSRRILYQILTAPNLVILISEEIVREYMAVIERDKFHKTIKVSQALRFLNLVMPKLEHVIIQSVVKQSRDPKDNYLLSLSVDGKADYLITGDLDLLVIEQIEQTKIVKLSDFLQTL
jgi:putative PIN family toxin of toxin-antitoxin system